MRRVSPILLGIMITALLSGTIPTAAAETSYEGTVDSPVDITGAARAMFQDGMLQVRGARAPEESRLIVNATGATATLYREAVVCPTTPGICADPRYETSATTYKLTNASLTLTKAADGLRLAISRTGGSGDFSLSTTSKTAASTLGLALTPLSMQAPADSNGASRYSADRDAAGFDYRSATTNLAGSGIFEMYLYNVTVRLAGDGKDGALDRSLSLRDTRWTDPITSRPEGELQYLVIHVDQGVIDAALAAPVVARADAVTVKASDSVLLRNAAGTFSGQTLNGVDVPVPGPLTLEPLARVGDSGPARMSLRVTVVNPPFALTEDQPTDTPGVAAGVAGGVGLTALAAAILYYWPRLKFALAGLLAPMYTRIEKNNMLEHGTRENIYGLIQTNPGIHAHEISTRTEIGWGTAVHHLRMMENARLIVSKRSGRYKRFYLSAGIAPAQKEAYGVLRNDTTRGIAQYVAEHPGCIQKEVCEAFGIQPSLTSWHMGKLEGANLVKKVREGRKVHYYSGPGWNEVNKTLMGTHTTPEPGIEA